LGDQSIEVRHHARHPIVAVDAGVLSLCHQESAARPEHTPHLPDRRHLQVLRQVVHDQTRYHDVKLLSGELQTFDRADLELAIAGTARLATGVPIIPGAGSIPRTRPSGPTA
jgi:hypothetical protein